MIEAGTILQNRYRVEKQIGQGGMGNVYVATDERFKSVVAIKETIFEDANLRKAFEREARLLNSLKHSALPRVSDHFDENKGQFLVMEFIAGDDLAAMMEKSGEAFPLETVLNWAVQLCNALEYLHAQDIIHRDIKPQNLKLTPKGEIVLLDFGLAKGSAIDAPHQTAAKSIFGFSRNYASLEQIQGAGTEPRSDLYSLSATLYHLLTGIPPADALTRAMNVLNGKSDPLIQANLVNRNVPAGVAEILQKTMALNADERPVSADEMRRMLDESDKTVDLSAAHLVGGNLLTAEFLTQDTKIIGAKTNLNPDGESKIATKIAAVPSIDEKVSKTNIADDDSASKVTMLRPVSDAPKPKRSKAVSTLILGGLLLIGSGLSAGYFFSADSAPSNEAVETPKVESLNNFAANKNENADIANVNVSNANTVLAEKEPASNKSPTETPVQTIETTKSDVKEVKKQLQNSQAASNKSNGDDEKIVVNGERIEMGDVIIDENGIRDRKTGKSLINDPSDNSKTLTPEQIRRLERIGERMDNRQKRIVVVKPPTPPTAPSIPQPTP